MKSEDVLYEMPSIRNMIESYLIQNQQELKRHIEAVDFDEVKNAVKKLNEFIDPLRINLRFELHEQLNEYYVQVVNPLTDEIVREIPPKKILDMYAAMAEFMGILVDEKI